MLAGDADTNGAIVGGLIGAFVGVSNIPQAKLQKVLECNHSKGNTKSRPDFVKPQKDGFNCIMTLLIRQIYLSVFLPKSPADCSRLLSQVLRQNKYLTKAIKVLVLGGEVQ